jgi:non-homologous end joining protein Ku
LIVADRHIAETKSADLDPTKFEDRYENAVVELVRLKEAVLLRWLRSLHLRT